MRIFYKRIICTCFCAYVSNRHAYIYSYHMEMNGGPGRDHRVGLFYAASLEGDGEYQMKLRVKLAKLLKGGKMEVLIGKP